MELASHWKERKCAHVSMTEARTREGIGARIGRAFARPLIAAAGDLGPEIRSRGPSCDGQYAVMRNPPRGYWFVHVSCRLGW